MAFVSDDVIEAVNSTDPKNIRIVICHVKGTYSGCIDLWNGEVGMIKTLVSTKFIFKSKERAITEMKRALEFIRNPEQINFV